jgi:hypothetical protein
MPRLVSKVEQQREHSHGLSPDTRGSHTNHASSLRAQAQPQISCYLEAEKLGDEALPAVDMSDNARQIPQITAPDY